MAQLTLPVFCSFTTLRYSSAIHPTSFEKGGDRGRSIESAYTNKNRHSVVSVSVCGGYEIRTHDLLHAMQAL